MARKKEIVEYKLGAKITIQSIYLLIKHKLTDKEIAQVLGIHLSTYKRWKRENKELMNLTRQAKLEIADLIENSLIGRAIGCEHKEITKEVVPVIVDVNGKRKTARIENKLIITKVVSRQIYSDEAAKFLLRNYNPAKFRNNLKESSNNKIINKIGIRIVEENGNYYYEFPSEGAWQRTGLTATKEQYEDFNHKNEEFVKPAVIVLHYAGLNKSENEA